MRFTKLSIVVVALVFLFSIMVPTVSNAADVALRSATRALKGVKALKQQVAEHETRITELESQAPGGAGIKVYDVNEQFIGFLLDSSSMQLHIKIFVPAVNKIAMIDQRNGEFQSGHGLQFEDDSCSGASYTNGTIDMIFKPNENEERYFVGVQPYKGQLIIRSRYSTLGCLPVSGGSWNDMFPAIEITDDMPWHSPLALPLSFVP